MNRSGNYVLISLENKSQSAENCGEKNSQVHVILF